MLIAFDFDGTLSEDEMIVLLGEQAGCAEEIKSITERAMNGELSYAESLRERVRLLSGLTDEAVATAFQQVKLRPRGAELLRMIPERAVTTAILTGGFRTGVKHALSAEDAAVTAIVANQLVFSNGTLSGEVTGPLIEGTKDTALKELASKHNLPLEKSIAVGDGANDIPMLKASGVSIGFNPKPTVRQYCDYTVPTITELTYLLTDLLDEDLA